METIIAYPGAFDSLVGQMFSKYGDVKFLDKKYAKFSTDLIVLVGGGDIDPQQYGHNNAGSYGIDKERDYFEWQVLRDIFSGRIIAKRVLGICRGMQMLNVAMGGNLVQNISKPHKSTHKVEWKVPNLFSEEFSEVNSMHHQGLAYYGDRYSPKILGVEPSSKIAEIVLWSNKFLGVQFHPECMGNSGKFAEIVAGWVNDENSIISKGRAIESERESIEEMIARKKKTMNTENWSTTGVSFSSAQVDAFIHSSPPVTPTVNFPDWSEPVHNDFEDDEE